jgi:hypothetical protein
VHSTVLVTVRLSVGAEGYGVDLIIPREEHESSSLTRDNIERSVTDALSELMDQGGI